MLTKDAINILHPEELTLESVTLAYRRAAMKYHPDKGGSVQMMQAVNEALETLQTAIDQGETIRQDEPTNYGDELNAALNAIIDLPGLDIEICGSWLWVAGDTRTHKDTLKAAGFKWAPKKTKWSFHPEGFKSYGRRKSSMEDIRAKYGSSRPNYVPSNRLARAS